MPGNVKSAIVKKEGKIVWYVWCTICGHKIDEGPNGQMIEARAKIYTEATHHTTIIGCMIVYIP